MSQYIHASSGGTQLTPTGRVAFGIVVSVAWLAVSGVLFLIVFNSDSVEEVVSQLPLALLLIAIFTLLGASTGTVMALLAGRTLSRQFCWILSLMVGIAGTPLLLAVFFRTLAAVPGARNTVTTQLFYKMSSSIVWIVPLTWVAGSIASIVLGVLLTRRRLGFATSAIRIARRVSIWSALIAIVMVLVWRVIENHGVSIFRIQDLAWEAVLVAAISVVSAAVAALIRTERRQQIGTRFEVLQAQPIRAEPISEQ